jgi:hypothetical protein
LQKKKNKQNHSPPPPPSFGIWQRIWTIKARDARRITAAEMKYMTRTAGYAWTDYKTYT